MQPHATPLALALLILAALLHAAEPIKERLVSFDVSPNFRIEGAHTEQPYASFEIGGRHLIWPRSAPKFESLQDGRKYRFDIIETRTVIPLENGSREFWSPELSKVSIGDTVIFDAALCMVHKQIMKRSEVPVIYGMPGGSTAYWTAFRDEFPNSGILHGGCVVMPDRATGMCWKCEKCISKKSAWKESTKDSLLSYF
jgi:hypothetical protein